MRLNLLSLLWFQIFLLLVGCSTPINKLPVHRGESCAVAESGPKQKLHMQYLGTGGFLMRYGTNAILTAPFFSNHSPLEVLFTPIAPKEPIIDRLLPNLDGVEAVLVGHCHHDHLIDLPYILKSSGSMAPVYGSQTMVNLLQLHVPNALTNVEPNAGGFCGCCAEGDWFTTASKKIRFMPLRSMHAPHIGSFTFFDGNVDKPRKRLPMAACGWKEGHSLAYIIDFMKDDGKAIAYRIMYHDSAVRAPDYGHLPYFSNPIDNRKPDLATLCLAAFSKVDGYPDQYLTQLEPTKVLIGHWDDFFRSPLKPLKSVKLTDAEAFFEKLGPAWKSKSVLPAPGACIHFDVPN